jgi:hypothetical protein
MASPALRGPRNAAGERLPGPVALWGRLLYNELAAWRAGEAGQAGEGAMHHSYADDERLWPETELDVLLKQQTASLLARCFFLSDPDYPPEALDDYHLGFLDPRVWLSLVELLDDSVDLLSIVETAEELEPLLGLDGVPTEALEVPWRFLTTVLEGGLPREVSGRRVDSRRLVKIARLVALLAQELPESAQAAIRAWAAVHRDLIQFYEEANEGEGEPPGWLDMGAQREVPPAVAGFGMMLSMTVMQWPERAEGLPLPVGFSDPRLRDAVYADWLALPDSAKVTEEGVGEAEALFAQGQLAHALARLGSLEPADPQQPEADRNVAYARLSRAILWIHSQCRHCPEREGVTCRAATQWPERPTPLVDVASEMASTARIKGCIRL